MFSERGTRTCLLWNPHQSFSTNTMKNLRRQAEERLREQPEENRRLSPVEADRLIHELHVHHIELELQNEELRAAQLQLQESHDRYMELYDFAPVGYVTVDDHGRITHANLTCSQLLGVERAQLLNGHFGQFIVSEDQDTYHLHYRQLLTTHTAQFCELRLSRKPEGTFYVHLKSTPVQDTERHITHIRMALTDITSGKQAEVLRVAAHEKAAHEKDVLMHEILHRTKNNMSAIISLLSLQSARFEDDAIQRLFQDIEQRIHAMLLVQQHLYQSTDVTSLDLKAYLTELAVTIFHNLCVETENTSLICDLDSAVVSPDTAIPCGLLLNELLTNALKYAFPDDLTGIISIRLHPLADDTFELRVCDNGVGIPDDVDIRNADSLGLQLVMSFVQQLHGTVELTRDQGTEWLIRFPERKTR